MMDLTLRIWAVSAALLVCGLQTTALGQLNFVEHLDATAGIDASTNSRDVLQVSAVSSPATAVGPRGGSLRREQSIQLETVVSPQGIRLFVYDLQGQPMVVDAGRGVASLRIQGVPKRYRYDLLPDGKGAFRAPINLARIVGRQVEIDIQLIGISGTKGRVAYKEVVSLPAPKEKSAPAERLDIMVTAATESDDALIARQKVCPVMDEPLGSMGRPIKVIVGDQPIFLCCKGCIKKVQAEPHKYLAMVYGENQGTPRRDVVPAGGEQVRAGVFKVTAADAPFVAAQKICPVMDEPLDAMGGPYKVDASGKAIYICCPGCAKKIAAEPAKYLGILAQQGIDAPLLR